MDEEERQQLIRAQLGKKTKRKSNKVMNIIFLFLAGSLVFGACGTGAYYLILYMP